MLKAIILKGCGTSHLRPELLTSKKNICFLFVAKHFRGGTNLAHFHWLNQLEIVVWSWCIQSLYRDRKRFFIKELRGLETIICYNMVTIQYEWYSSVWSRAKFQCISLRLADVVTTLFAYYEKNKQRTQERKSILTPSFIIFYDLSNKTRFILGVR